MESVSVIFSREVFNWLFQKQSNQWAYHYDSGIGLKLINNLKWIWWQVRDNKRTPILSGFSIRLEYSTLVLRDKSMWLKQTDLALPFFFQFLSQDLPLFEGIVSDLFPGITLPSPDHGVLEEALKKNIKKMGLQAVPWFVDKVVQVCSKFSAVRISKAPLTPY